MTETTWIDGLPHADRYTERLKRALALGVEEAELFRHDYLGTEHLLLGLLAEGQGLGAKALLGFGLEISRLREALLMAVGRGDRPVSGVPALTPRSQRVLQLAVEECRGLNHTYIGQEHLLLALTRRTDQADQGDCDAADTCEFMSITLLERTGVDVEALRRILKQALGRGARAGARDNVIACRVDDRVLDSIDALIEAGIHATRSEAAARLILDGLEMNRPLLERVQAAVADIRRLRDQTQRLAEQWRAERAASPGTPDDAFGPSSGEEKGTSDRAVPAAPKRSRRQSG